MVTQTNVLGAITANVIQGLADTNQFGGLKVAPEISQNGLSVNWPVIELAPGEMLRNNIKDRAAGAGFDRMDAKITLDTSTVTGEGLEVLIDKSLAEDGSKRGLNAISVYGRELMLNAWRNHETDVSGLAQGSGFDTTNSIVAYTQGNIDTIDFAQDLQVAIELIAGRGEMADTVVIPVTVWNRIRNSALLRSYIVGSIGAGAAVTPSNIQKAFAEDGINQVIIGRPRVNTATKNKSTISTIWSASHLWVGATRTPSGGGDGNTIAGSMATFFNDEQAAPFQLEQYWSDERRSHVLRVFGETNTKIVNAPSGTRITTQFA